MIKLLNEYQRACALEAHTLRIKRNRTKGQPEVADKLEAMLPAIRTGELPLLVDALSFTVRTVPANYGVR